MTSRRTIRIQRTAWGTAMWFLSARASVFALVCAAVITATILMATTRPWDQTSDPQVIVVPIPVPVPTTTPPPGDVVQIPTIPPAGTPTYSRTGAGEPDGGRAWTA